jgi:hypothetical protein
VDEQHQSLRQVLRLVLRQVLRLFRKRVEEQ